MDSTRAAGLNDIVKFEEVLNVRIHVVVIDSRFHFITPPMKPDDKRKSIYVAVSMADTLNFEEGHAYPAVFPAALFDAPYFCHYCQRSYYSVNGHSCSRTCKMCTRRRIKPGEEGVRGACIINEGEIGRAHV